MSLFKKLSELLSEHDKRQHFGYSLVIMLALQWLMPLWLAFLITFLIGLIKEIWDHYWGSGFCWQDMKANMLGILLAVLIYFILLIAVGPLR